MTTPTSERTLILVRHAKAEQVDGKPDHDRELTSRGRNDARAIGEWLLQASQAGAIASGDIDLVLCSTSVRTRQTLDALSAGGASIKDTRFDKRIYNAGAADLLIVLREVPDTVSTLLVIGHAPGIPVIATALAQDGAGSTEAAERVSHGYPTAGTAVLGFRGPWSAVAPEAAYLKEFDTPRG